DLYEELRHERVAVHVREEPQEMINVGREQADDFEFKPAKSRGDDDQCEREYSSGAETVDVAVTDGDGKEGERECKPRHNLRAIDETMADHACGHDEHQQKIKRLRCKDASGRNVMHRVGGEV